MGIPVLSRDVNNDLHWKDPSNGVDLFNLRQSTHDLYIPQGEARGRTPVTANYTVLPSDRKVCYTALAAARTVTLPAASSMANKHITVKDEAGAAATNNITVSVASAGTIDGAASKVINANFGVLNVYSNGTQWFTT
ncbi:MAG: hypothetical protein ACRDVE_15675 [Actinocrinis sp.]